MDWGIAKILGTEGATDTSIIGTACYMSPEQAHGNRRSLDARSDVFLLGGLLYELLTNRPPYVSKDRAETLLMAQAGIVRSPRQRLRIPDLQVLKARLRADLSAG